MNDDEQNLSGRRSMTVLSIEISTPSGQVALVRGDEVLFSAKFASQRSHNAQLFAPLRDALAVAEGSLDLIVIGTGPGSYTGVRIAIAAAHGISLSRGAPVVGLSSAIVPDDAGDESAFQFVGDARRDSYYTATIQDGDLRGELQLVPQADIQLWLQANKGMPVFTYDSVVARLDGVCLSSPSAVALAKRAQRFSKEEIAKLTALPIEPIYVREAFITTPKRPWLQV